MLCASGTRAGLLTARARPSAAFQIHVRTMTERLFTAISLIPRVGFQVLCAMLSLFWRHPSFFQPNFEFRYWQL